MLVNAINIINEQAKAATSGSVKFMLTILGCKAKSLSYQDGPEYDRLQKFTNYVVDRRCIEQHLLVRAKQDYSDAPSCSDASRRAFSAMVDSYKRMEALNVLVIELRRIERSNYRSDEPYISPEQRWATTHQGKKPQAYQVKRNERGLWSGAWDEHRISKCWKDQRGKGRNKRNTQYRAVVMA